MVVYDPVSADRRAGAVGWAEGRRHE
jgi:hypothetical protein